MISFEWPQTTSSSIIATILLQKPVTLNFFSLSKYFVDIGTFNPLTGKPIPLYLAGKSSPSLFTHFKDLALDFSESTQCCKHVTFLSIFPYLTLLDGSIYQSQFLIYIRYSNTCLIN